MRSRSPLFLRRGGCDRDGARRAVNPNGKFLSDDTYNKLFTLHGIVMVWFFLMPSIPNTFGNFLLPLMIGAQDVAFPRLNLLSWYLNIAGGLFTLSAVVAGGRRHRLDLLHAVFDDVFQRHVLAAAAGVFVAGFSSIATGVNFIATMHMLRPGG